MEILKVISLQLHSLVIFRNLLNDKVIIKLLELLDSIPKSISEQIDSYSAFVSQLFMVSDNLTEYMIDKILEDENIYILKYAEGGSIDIVLEECMMNELILLQEISQLNASTIRTVIKYDSYLPAWKTRRIDFVSVYMENLGTISKSGYGIFRNHNMFFVKDGLITPVKHPDNIRLSNLKGYRDERKAVVDNTKALLKGKPAANVLLYGDAGTGKSSTVKAIANEYKNQGLRIIEIKKKQLNDIPLIMERISKSCLKFIIFIDDLSFNKSGDDFGALKAALEGSISAKTSNVAIYATSNRRHLIKESFSDREGDDIHINDTIQEMISLSERFGLTINFFKPDKEQYLEIVHEIGKECGIKMSRMDLDIEAERYASRRGGRSPRIAKHFIEHLINTEK